MSDTPPPPTPVGDLIRRAREMAIPRLSRPEVAHRAGIDPGTLGNLERGYRYTGAGRIRQVTGDATVIAKVARVLQIDAGRLEKEGGRPDAAAALRAAGAPAPPSVPPRPRQPPPGEPPMSEEAFAAYLLPAQNEHDRQVIEACMKLVDEEGRLLPWEERWPYVEVVLSLRHGRNGQEAGLIPPVVESELLLNPHAREIARHAHQIRRKPCGPPLSAVPMDTECDCFTPVASRGGWGVPVKRPGGEQQCRR